MRRWLAASALALGCLSATPAAAVDPQEFMRPCRRHDLIGMWRVMVVRVPGGGAPVDRTDPAFLPHQRYIFHSNATMAHATQDVPFTVEEQRALFKSPATMTWAMESEGRLLRQRDGVAAVEKADCRILTRAVRDSGTTQLTAQPGDILLTDERGDERPATRRLLRRIRGISE